MVKVIRERSSGRVHAVIDDANDETEDSVTGDGGAFFPRPAENEELVHYDGSSEQLWQQAEQSVDGMLGDVYLYDDGSIEAIAAPYQPTTNKEAALMEIRQSAAEKGKSSDEPLTVDDVDKAIERVRGEDQ